MKQLKMLNTKEEFEYLNPEDFVELTQDELKVVKKITDYIWKDGSRDGGGRLVMTNAEIIPLQHHDGSLKFGEWGNIAVYSRSKSSTNIRFWYNKTYKKNEVKKQIEAFIISCKADKLPIVFGE